MSMLYVEPPLLPEWLRTSLERTTHGTSGQLLAATFFNAGRMKKSDVPRPTKKKIERKAITHPIALPVETAFSEIAFGRAAASAGRLPRHSSTRPPPPTKMKTSGRRMKAPPQRLGRARHALSGDEGST